MYSYDPEEEISIHAPRGGSDRSDTSNVNTRRQFQSTLPVGGATITSYPDLGGTPFQSTLPVGGATSVEMYRAALEKFQSTLPVGGATADNYKNHLRIA